ncbi:MAG: glycerol-3-phosphate responsive antiterminator [Lachnospiraceae bacterium]|nr:glycerol-3-phosphate responsive antiterminator [Lachnospiraceae bacterium]
MALTLEELLQGNALIPSVSDTAQLKYAVKEQDFPCIMVKTGDISTIASILKLIHNAGKRAMVHLDSLKGIARDKEGIHYLKRIGTDSLITMKPQTIRIIKDSGIFSLLGTFLVDSASVKSAIQNVHTNKPDALILMPMTIPEETYRYVLNHVDIPLIAGGLGLSVEIITRALSQGLAACAVTDPEVLKRTQQILQRSGQQL